MIRNRMLLLLGACLLTVPSALGAGRWDVVFDGHWFRCAIDVNEQNESVTAMLYDATAPGKSVAMIENLVVIGRGENYVLQGTITSGKFEVGMGKLSFAPGDRFYLWVSRYTDDVMLALVHDLTSYWCNPLHWMI